MRASLGTQLTIASSFDFTRISQKPAINR